MSNPVFLASCIFPPASDASVSAARKGTFRLLRQIELFCASWFRYHRCDSSLVLFTNDAPLIAAFLEKRLTGKRILSKINFLPSRELSHCQNHEGAHFTYAFSKLDAIHRFFDSDFYGNDVQVILTDIDVLLLNSSDAFHDRKATDLPCAIDYFCEHTNVSTNNFADVIIKVFPDLDPSVVHNTVASRQGWINSGFLWMDQSFMLRVVQNSATIVDRIRANKSFIETKIGHYSDELVFSALAFAGDFIRLSDFKPNGVAMFLWTCPTICVTPCFVSIVDIPFHLHLPASKSQPWLQASLLHIVYVGRWFPSSWSSSLIVIWLNALNFFWYRGALLRCRRALKKLLF